LPFGPAITQDHWIYALSDSTLLACRKALKRGLTQPSVAMGATNNYVVVWQDVLNVYTRIYDTSGAALSGAFRANTD